MLKPVIVRLYGPCDKPKFIKPYYVKFNRGKDNTIYEWEMIEGHNSVHCILVNLKKREIVLVGQIRIPVLINDNSQNGMVIEACAGLMDKNLSMTKTIQEEILEEVGYKVPLDSIFTIREFKSSVGISGKSSFAFIAYISEDMKVSEGGGLDNEDIQPITLSFNEAMDLLYNQEHLHIDAITAFLILHVLYKYEVNS